MSNLPPPPTSWTAPTPDPPQPGYGTCWPDLGAVRYAGFWSRAGAWLFDVLVLMVPWAIAGGICLANGWNIYEGETAGEYEWELRNKGFAAAAISFFIAGFLCWFVVRVRGWTRGQTPGMKLAGNRIVRVGTLQPVGTGRAVGRFFAGYLSSWLFGLGYLWAAWDKQKRTWHDMMCETIVIKA